MTCPFQKQTARAIVEYTGPEGPYRMRITDGQLADDDQVSEVDESEFKKEKEPDASSELPEEASGFLVPSGLQVRRSLKQMHSISTLSDSQEPNRGRVACNE